jgi:hypothetical protein
VSVKKPPQALCLILSLLFIVTTTALKPHQPWRDGNLVTLAQEPEPTPMIDRFAVPEMPENPTQVEVGENVYYYNCMPCHGDRGQGLTDEFREAWVDDHQNCWAHGCHNAGSATEAFPIPKFVPAVIASQLNIHFPTAQKLYDYLSREHPPQNPGALKSDEYWALTAFLWFENGQLPMGVELAPERDDLSVIEQEDQPVRKIEPEERLHTDPVIDQSPELNLISLGMVLFVSVLAISLIWIFWKKKNTNYSTLKNSEIEKQKFDR